MDMIRVAVIGRTGRGDWGHDIDGLWRGLPAATVVAAADDSDEGLAQAARRHGLPATAAFRDWRAMLAEVGSAQAALGKVGESLGVNRLGCHG